MALTRLARRSGSGSYRYQRTQINLAPENNLLDGIKQRAARHCRIITSSGWLILPSFER